MMRSLQRQFVTKQIRYEEYSLQSFSVFLMSAMSFNFIFWHTESTSREDKREILKNHNLINLTMILIVDGVNLGSVILGATLNVPSPYQIELYSMTRSVLSLSSRMIRCSSSSSSSKFSLSTVRYWEGIVPIHRVRLDLVEDGGFESFGRCVLNRSLWEEQTAFQNQVFPGHLE